MAQATPKRPRNASPPDTTELVTFPGYHATPRRYRLYEPPRRSINRPYRPPRTINSRREVPSGETTPPPSGMSYYREPRASNSRNNSYGHRYQDSFFPPTETLLSPPLTPAYQPPSSPGYQPPRPSPPVRYGHGYPSPFPSPALSLRSDTSTFTEYRGYEPGEESLPLTRRPVSEVQLALEAEAQTAQRDSRWKKGIRYFRFVVRFLNFGCSVVVMALLLTNLTSIPPFRAS
jgi:hypothetical protein